MFPEGSASVDDIELQPAFVHGRIGYYDNGDSYTEVYMETKIAQTDEPNVDGKETDEVDIANDTMSETENKNYDSNQTQVPESNVPFKSDGAYTLVRKSLKTDGLQDDMDDGGYIMCGDTNQSQTNNASTSEVDGTDSSSDNRSEQVSDDESDGDIYTNVQYDMESMTLKEVDDQNDDTQKTRVTRDSASKPARAPVPQPRLSLKSRLPDPYDYPPRRALSLQYESHSSNPEKFNTMEGLDIKEIRITAENIDPIHEELTSDIPVQNYAAQTDDEDAVYDVPRHFVDD